MTTRYYLCMRCNEITTVSDPVGRAEPYDESRCNKGGYCHYTELVRKDQYDTQALIDYAVKLTIEAGSATRFGGHLPPQFSKPKSAKQRQIEAERLDAVVGALDAMGWAKASGFTSRAAIEAHLQLLVDTAKKKDT
jgi:hypothetical protein